MAAHGVISPPAAAGDEPAVAGAPSAHGASRAVVIQLISWGATIPTGLVITALLAHSLGAAQYGEYSFVVPFLGVFGLVGAIGMDPLIIRRLSRDPRPQWAETLDYAVGSRLVSTSISALAVVLLALLLPLSSDERTLLLIGSASLLFGFQIGSMRSVYDNAFRAEQRVAVPAILLMTDRLLTAGLVALAVVLHLSLLWIYFLIVFSDLPFFVAMVAISRRRFGVRVRFSLARLREHVRTGLPLVSYDALVQVAWRADLFLLMALVGPVSVGIYALALRVTDPLFAIVMAYVGGLYPLLCSTFEQGQHAFRRTSTEATRLLALGTLPLAIFISVEARPIVTLLGGRHFLPAIPSLIVLMWATAAGFYGQLAVRTSMAANLERTIPYVMAVAAGVNVVASLVLIPHWQSTGAAIGALLSVVAELALFLILLASRANILPPFGTLLRVTIGNLPGLVFLLWLRHTSLLLTCPGYVLVLVVGCIASGSLSWGDLATAKRLLLSRTARAVPRRAAPAMSTQQASLPAGDAPAALAAGGPPHPPTGRRRRWWQAGRARARRAGALAVAGMRLGAARWQALSLRAQASMAMAAAHSDRPRLRSLLRATLRTSATLEQLAARWREQSERGALLAARIVDKRAGEVLAALWRLARWPATIRHTRPLASASAPAASAVAARATLHVSVTRGLPAIANLAEEWRALLARASRPTVFQSPEWLETWCRHLGNGEPWLVQVRTADGTLVGLVPLQLQRPGVGPFRLRLLRWLGYGKGALTDALGPVIATGYETAALAAAFTHLVRAVPGWDLLDLDRNRDELVEAVRQWAPSSGCRLQVYKSAGWLYIRLPADWATLQRTLSKNLRSNLPRYRNRLLREGHTTRFTLLTAPDDVAAALPRFLELHALRAGASDLKYHSNYFESDASRRFLLDIARTLSAQGRLALAQMEVDGTVGAAQLLLFQGRMMTTYFSGFDPAWSRYSIMLLTQKACIEEAIARGMQWVDLTAGAGGEDQTKRQWGNEETLTKHLMVTRPTVGGAVTDWVLRRWYILRRLQMWRHQSHRRSLSYILRLPVADPPASPATPVVPDAEVHALPEEVGQS